MMLVSTYNTRRDTMANETREKIIQSTLKLIVNRGYTLTTTKDIAKGAGVSEVTIFRKFKNKQGIIECILQEYIKFPELDMSILDKCNWILEEDLKRFSDLYFKYVTDDYVKLVIGLRSPELFPLIEKYVVTIPSTFKQILINYFSIMYEKGRISNNNFEVLVLMFISLNFGFIFMKASFGNDLTSLQDDEYIKESIKMFAKGI